MRPLRLVEHGMASQKIIAIPRLAALVLFVALVTVNLVRAMQHEQLVAIVIANAQNQDTQNAQTTQNSSELTRGIIKRNNKSKEKKTVTWGADSTIPNSANSALPEQKDDQADEQKSDSRPEYQWRCEPITDAWRAQVDNLLATVLSERQKSALEQNGFEEDFTQAFLELWPTQRAFYSTGGSFYSDEDRKNERHQLFLAALAARQHKKNDQLLAEINIKRARLKPYGYILWPLAIMGVCFLETLFARIAACPG